MKIIKEDIENLERSINDEKVDVIGSMPITMADAFYDSEKKQEQVDKEMNEKESKVKLNKVLGAEKQPVPDLPVQAKSTLDESLFEDYDEAREYTNKLLDMVDEGLLDPKDLIASMALYMSDDDVKDLMYTYGYIEDEIDESLKDPRDESLEEKVEKGSKISKRKSTLPGGKYSEPEPDEFTLVQMELNGTGDWYTLKDITKFPELKPRKRYPADDIGQDYDGNTIIFGTKDSDFDFARKVADAYELEISDPIVDKQDPNKMKVIIETSVLVDSNS